MKRKPSASTIVEIPKPPTRAPTVLFAVAQDGSLKPATADDVGWWVFEEKIRSDEVSEVRIRAELTRWPEARPGWRMTYQRGHGASAYVWDVRYLYGGDVDAFWLTGSLGGAEPESWWIEAWNPVRIGTKLPRRGPYPDFERACVAVEIGGPPLPWPPEPRLPDDPRVSDTMRCLDIAKQWQQLAYRLHGALTPFREVEGVREVWNDLWSGRP